MRQKNYGYNRHKHELKSKVLQPKKTIKKTTKYKLIRCNITNIYTLIDIINGIELNIDKNDVFYAIETTKQFNEFCTKKFKN